MTDTPTLRLDVWLWRTRFFKTRALSGTYIRKRGVRLTRNGQTRRVNKPGAAIYVGDVVTLARGAHIRTVEVLDLGTRRGPAEEAAAMYTTLETDT
ncbi:RNA-binding S4 domain-containing protein [Hyphomonas sp.]|uniref:RNA-binding S4 domain-containing protein n=1 Tax=Hyphomonas sp. TaxID=87 RepID=UPI000DFA2693|nr:RNA-binding S4 domain-containing protein [Hyphomonas sp.]RCL90201.1 MAG: RNA-binding S4 domain-containing protein [Hyphomonas sp.]